MTEPFAVKVIQNESVQAGHALRARLIELDDDLRQLSEAAHDLQLLCDELADANVIGIVDMLVSLEPFEVVLGVAKHDRIARARERGARARDALLRLSRNAELRRDASHAAGPARPFALSDANIALLDSLFAAVDLCVAAEVTVWRSRSVELRERVADATSGLLRERAELERRLADAAHEYQALVASA